MTTGGQPPAFPTWGTGAGGGGYGGSSYTPQPYGQSYADAGLVYGIGTPTYWQGGTNSLAAIAGASKWVPKSGVELGRAANWITGTLANDRERERYQGYFKRFFPQGGSFDQYGALWSNAAQYAAQVNRDDPNARWTPWDALDRMWSLYSKGGGGGAGGGGSSFSSTSTSVNLTGKDESDATLDQALSNLLGRTATDAEKKQFLSSLNAAERANPTVQTSSGTTSASGASRSSSTTKSTSVSPAARAQSFAQNEEGFAEYQYATTYMDAMLEALNSPVRM
jgi:hypothetical protein